MTPRKAEIEARDKRCAEIMKKMPGLTSWTVWDPQFPDTDLYLSSLLEAYTEDPAEHFTPRHLTRGRQLYAAAVEARQRKCFECKQEKPAAELTISGAAHLHHANKPHEWVQTFICDDCKAERARLLALGVHEYGHSVRKARNELDLSLREFAMHTIGPDIVRLSSIELGRVEALPEEKAAIASAIEDLRLARSVDAGLR